MIEEAPENSIYLSSLLYFTSMGLRINLVILLLFIVTTASFLTIGYFVDGAKKDNDIGTVIAFATLVGTIFCAADEFVKALHKLITFQKCSEESRQDCNEPACKDWEKGCCKHKCRHKPTKEVKDGCYKSMKERYRKYAQSKWPLVIHFVLLNIAITLCLVSFLFNLPTYLFNITRGVSGTTINVYGMGQAVVNNDPHNTTLWSGTDVAVPDLENVVSFITTKREKIHQSLGNCSESREIEAAHCTTNDDCKAGDIYELGNGIATGNCLNGTCEVRAWCSIDPAESDGRVTVEELNGVGQYTLHVINHIYFDVGGGKRYSNSLKKFSCTYDEHEHDDCPIFPVEYIVRKAMGLDEKLTKFPKEGTTISIELNYNCDINDEQCLPKYNFTQLYTDPAHLADFDYSKITYPYSSTNDRVYVKATGLLFLVEVDATIQYRSNAKLLGSTAGAFVAVQTTKPLSGLISLIFVVFPGFCCFCSCCSSDKLCCIHSNSLSSDDQHIREKNSQF